MPDRSGLSFPAVPAMIPGCYFAFGRSIIFAGQKKYPSDNGEKVYDMYTVMGIYSFISDRNS